MQRIFHPNRGIVITNDQAVIDEILAEGGKLISSLSEVKRLEVQTAKAEPELLDDLIGDDPVEKIPAPVTRPHRKGK